MDMSVAEFIGLVLRLCILSTVFALGLKATWEGTSPTCCTGRNCSRARCWRCTCVTPLIAAPLVLVFTAPLPVKIAVLLMAISAGAPALPKKLFKLGANPPYVYSLAVIMALLAIVTVPLARRTERVLSQGRQCSLRPGCCRYRDGVVCAAPRRHGRALLLADAGRAHRRAAHHLCRYRPVSPDSPDCGDQFLRYCWNRHAGVFAHRCDDACLIGGRPCPGWTGSKRSHHSGARLCDSFPRPGLAHCIVELSQREAAADRGRLLINGCPSGDAVYALAKTQPQSTKPRAIKGCRSTKVIEVPLDGKPSCPARKRPPWP